MNLKPIPQYLQVVYLSLTPSPASQDLTWRSNVPFSTREDLPPAFSDETPPFSFGVTSTTMTSCFLSFIATSPTMTSCFLSSAATSPARQRRPPLASSDEPPPNFFGATSSTTTPCYSSSDASPKTTPCFSSSDVVTSPATTKKTSL